MENNEYNKITISIENLNDLENYKRLKRDKIKDILVKYPKLKFTYDIGHELIDGNLQLSLSEIFLERINNVHVHIFEGKEDHYPIIELNEKEQVLLTAIKKLKENGYDDILVTEYSFDYIDGNNYEEKLVNYIIYSQNLLKLTENL